MEFYYISDSVWDEKHVATTHIDEICSNLATLGHRVTLYIPSIAKPQSERRYTIAYVPTFAFMKTLWFQIDLFFLLLQDIRRRAPEVLYARSSSLLFVPALISKMFAIPLVLEVNGKLSEEVFFEGTILSKILFYSGIFKSIESFSVRSASGFVAVKEGVRDYIAERYAIDRKRIRVILNGVDVSLFKPTSVADARKRTALLESAFYVGYVGSFYEWQGLRHIAEAAKLVCAQNREVKFLLLGSGAEDARLRAFVADNALESCVEIRPAVGHGEIPEYINSMDICLSYPDISRGGVTSPFKVYEYLACGKCVVSSDIKGMREEFGEVIAYAPPESADMLAKVLMELLQDAQKRASLESRGRAWVEKGHSWESVAQETAEFCKFLLV